MTPKAATPEEYLADLPEDKQAAVSRLRTTLLEHLPRGFSETMAYGMLTYVVPHSLYPAGYHVNPAQALPFISVAAQKNFIALYHMGLYADPSLLAWFRDEYPRHSKTRLDMGKSCIRFKKPEQIPYSLIGELAAKITPQKWIGIYEQEIKPSGR
jgi:hypothetical protein